MSVVANRPEVAVRPAGRSWIAEGDANAATRVYCFHPAGGAASFYRGWSKTAFPGAAVRAAQLPGRESRIGEAPHRTMRDAVAEIIDGMDRQLNERPGADDIFFGYSLGSLVAFETIRELRRRGRKLPGKLIIAGMASPLMPEVRPQNTSALPDADIIEEIRRSKSVPEMILRDHSVMQTVLPTIRADFRLVETYRAEAEAPLSMPIVAYGGLSDPYFKPCDVSSWGAVTTASFRLRFFAGDHYFLKANAAELFADLANENRMNTCLPIRPMMNAGFPTTTMAAAG
jgi:medium-chain acyl-[acyl-carrier-protein] hydrolase